MPKKVEDRVLVSIQMSIVDSPSQELLPYKGFNSTHTFMVGDSLASRVERTISRSIIGKSVGDKVEVILQNNPVFVGKKITLTVEDIISPNVGNVIIVETDREILIVNAVSSRRGTFIGVVTGEEIKVAVEITAIENG